MTAYRPDQPISVIVPVFDRVTFLEEAVASVLAQDHELEVVIVDDGSTDGTSALADRLAEADARVRVVHQANAGAGAARNVAMRAARHDLVANQDSDDVMLPGRLARQLGFLVDHPGAVAMVAMARKEVMPGRAPVNLQLTRHGNVDPGAMSTLLVDRRIALDVGGYDEHLVVAEDLELLVRLTAAGHRFEHLEEVVSIRRFHDTNISAAEVDPEATLLALMRRHLLRSRAAE